MAEPASLIQIFLASFEPDANTRKNAESQLKAVETIPGMPTAALQIVASSETPIHVRQAAAVYLKNRCNKSWDRETDSRHAPFAQTNALKVHDEDRVNLKRNILPVLCASPELLKVQLKTTLNAMVGVEMRSNTWPELLPAVMTGLTGGQEGEIEGSLLALIEIFKVYRCETSSLCVSGTDGRRPKVSGLQPDRAGRYLYRSAASPNSTGLSSASCNAAACCARSDRPLTTFHHQNLPHVDTARSHSSASADHCCLGHTFAPSSQQTH